jgi:hypothetical protein
MHRPLFRAACLLVALLLGGATLAATTHGHATDGDPCATCVFAGSSAVCSQAPRLPQPMVVAVTSGALLPDAPGFAPPPLAVAPKNGPPVA